MNINTNENPKEKYDFIFHYINTQGASTSFLARELNRMLWQKLGIGINFQFGVGLLETNNKSEKNYS